MKRILALVVVLFTASFGYSQAYQLPNDDNGCPANCRVIPWQAGSDLWNGGILPTYTGVTCNGLAGDGTTNDGPAIQACLNAVSAQQCSVVPAGTYLVNTNLSIPSNKCLRGARALGPPWLPAASATTTTFIFGTAGLIHMGTHSSANLGTIRTIASGYTKGSTSITMAAGHGFAIGNFIIVSENPDADMVSTGVGVTKTGIDGACNWCGWDDGIHLMSQVVQVTNVVSNFITLSRPLYFTFKSALNPVARTLAMSVTKAGIENIRLDGSVNNHTNPFISIGDASFFWVKGVEDYMAGSGAKNAHVYMEWTYGGEIRDSYFHRGRTYTSDNNYGIYFFDVNSDTKVENNIARLCRHCTVLEGGGSGIVFLYNYIDDNQEDDPTYMAMSLVQHGAHPYMNLWEGNIYSHLGADAYWGSSSHNVLFRNSLWGDETQTSEITQKPSYGYWPFEVWKLNYYFSLVGNVGGITGKWGNPTWSGYTLRNANCSGADFIYSYGCNFLGAGSYDAAAGATSINHGNYDMKTHGVAFWEGGANHTLAPSIYYASKPVFLGNLLWPGIGPDITGGNLSGTDGTVNQNPAYACFVSASGACYSGAVTAPTIYRPTTFTDLGVNPILNPTNGFDPDSSTFAQGTANNDPSLGSTDYSIIYKGIPALIGTTTQARLNVRNSFFGINNGTGGADYSLDNGSSWIGIWSGTSHNAQPTGPLLDQVTLSPMQDFTTVQVRFIGNGDCDPPPCGALGKFFDVWIQTQGTQSQIQGLFQGSVQ